MPWQSPFNSLNIPQVDILTYLLQGDVNLTDYPIWFDAENPSQCLTMAQALELASRVAAGLDRLEVPPGDVILTLSPNSISIPPLYLGIVGSGRIFSGASPSCTVSELRHQMKDTGTNILLVDPHLLQIGVEAAKLAGLPMHRIICLSGTDEACTFLDVRSWVDFLASPDEAKTYVWPALSGESMTKVAAVNYSSGTTGLPKGVAVSHFNVVANVEQMLFMMFLNEPEMPKKMQRENWLGFLPLNHAYGQLLHIIAAAKLQMRVYIMNKVVYTDLLRLIQEHSISRLHAVPPILSMLKNRPETGEFDLTSLRSIDCAGAPLSTELQNSVSRDLNVTIHQGWGMTELTCGASCVPGRINERTGSIGQLFPNTCCRLVDEDGVEMTDGNPGELQIRGPQVCLGYWHNTTATADLFTQDGWLKTGDIGIQRNGWLYLIDRKKELIKVNALQVAPAELESVITQHEAVDDAGVVGITLHGQEWPRAYVKLRDNFKTGMMEDDIAKWVQGKVSKHKQLRGGVAFVEDVPRLPSGKIKRKALREWAQQDARALMELAGEPKL